MRWRTFGLLALLLTRATSATPASAQVTTSCQYILGFNDLHDQIPAIIGDCLDNEAHNSVNGDALQHSTQGLLVWRKAENTMAFTNGATTWVVFEGRVSSRPANVRFSWESNPDKVPVTDGTFTQAVGSCPVPTADPRGPVYLARLVFPDPGRIGTVSSTPCLTSLADTTTDRLWAYLSANPHTALCRCQDTPTTQTITATPTAVGWTVQVSQAWGPATIEQFEVIVVESRRGWLIDDIRCSTDDPSTSVYAGSRSRCITS